MRKSHKIASYRTERGALRYALELAKTWPSVTFCTRPHPYDFTRTVVAFMPNGSKAYVLKRPRGGPSVQMALV